MSEKDKSKGLSKEELRKILLLVMQAREEVGKTNGPAYVMTEDGVEVIEPPKKDEDGKEIMQ